jgi:hypothetical protein
MPRIEHYSFGKIVIDGQQYKSDVIIYPNRIDDRWWRAGGHNLIISDLPFVPKHLPKILVIGQGKYGFMKISQEFQNFIVENKMDCHMAKTSEAVEIYNNLWNAGERDMVAAFHLTC